MYKFFSEISLHLKNNVLLLQHQILIELWCNGNTTVSGSVVPGSNPGSSTKSSAKLQSPGCGFFVHPYRIECLRQIDPNIPAETGPNTGPEHPTETSPNSTAGTSPERHCRNEPGTSPPKLSGTSPPKQARMPLPKLAGMPPRKPRRTILTEHRPRPVSPQRAYGENRADFAQIENPDASSVRKTQKSRTKAGFMPK